MLRKIKKISKKQIKRFIALIVVAFIALGFSLVFVHRAGQRVYQLDVRPGTTVSMVADNLKRSGIIESAASFKLAVRIQGGRIQSGFYDIPRNASAWEVAKMLTHGDIATTKILIPEGYTIKQVKTLLLADETLSGDVECLGNNFAPVCDLRDGDIFPDTYRVARGTLRLQVLELARKKMETIKSKMLKRKFPKPLESWNDVLTLASIVQKETPRESEMPVVASVYLNRLRKNMRLQADPTVVYALTDGFGDMHGEPLLTGHLKIDSPYNTYRNNGLPPTPISNVGTAAIRAVLKPADTNYLFFVADGRGGHNFANSYEDHLKNHADWREIKKSKNYN